MARIIIILLAIYGVSMAALIDKPFGIKYRNREVYWFQNAAPYVPVLNTVLVIAIAIIVLVNGIKQGRSK